MTYHVGEPVTFKGDRYLVKRIDGERLAIEDDEGFTINVEAILVGRPRQDPRCWLCRRDVSDGDYVRVDFGLTIEPVCSVCWEKRDEDGIDIPLDMTEDEA
jgi:hypothetical protein